MKILSTMLVVVLAILFLLAFILLVMVVYYFLFDRKQKEHSVLRNYPLIGRMRYFLEKIGPELRQYWFDSDSEGKPIPRDDYIHIVKAAKYKRQVIGFGAKRDFDKEGFYIRNDMFPRLTEELDIDRDTVSLTNRYLLIRDPLFTRRVEKLEKDESLAYLLRDEDAVVIGPKVKNPFVAKGIIGMSAMSYGALGKNAITALSKGLAQAKGTWMNTGEGGLSPYHLEGGVDLIMQIGPALFGIRDSEGRLDEKELKRKSELPEIKAFEIKLAQGAKTRGGHIDAEKVTPEIADIRKLVPYHSIDSPNRFHEFDNVEKMCEFIEYVRGVTEKPVGVKIVVGGVDSVIPLAKYMRDTGKGPDFITIDGSEGGTGASYPDLSESVGLPIKSALPILHATLKKYGVRDKVKIIASGKLYSPDKIAIALAMGADLVNIARGFMISVGCIQTLKCHTNSCPVGVTTTDEDLQKALVVDEKKHRVANYVITLRKGLFRVSAAAGLQSPTQFSEKNIMYKDDHDVAFPLETILQKTYDQIPVED